MCPVGAKKLGPGTLGGQSAQAALAVSEELVCEELADWEAEHEPGGHWAIRNRTIRCFWWTAFAGKDETTWERFWAQFPKHLRDKCAARDTQMVH